MRFILENIEQLLPIVIFIIIAVSSVLGKKKRGEGEDIPVPQRDHGYEGEEDGGFDELRGVLEDIFQGKKTQSAQHKQTAKAHHVDADIVKQKKIADRRAKEKAKAKGLDSLVAQAYVDLSPQVTKAGEIAAYETAPEQSESALTATARNGIVWAEILNRPVAMRQLFF
jgi:hypothetical protein